jgi:4-diphosphocytidyl-2-C-methyl-D-erythritol kinase
MSLSAEAFAKTNVSLRVVGRRPDGYHELDTVFQTIDLADRLEVSEAPEIRLECDVASLPTGPDNLVVRAATLLAQRSGTRAGARIRLVKKIPVGGGLGGGSSDAAVALGLLARLWKVEADRDFLARIGRDLGSDVPFFFFGGTARGTGRGDELTLLPADRERRLVLVVPPFSISTADVYRNLRSGREASKAVKILSVQQPGGYFGVNDLASAVLETKPEMAHYLKAVEKSFPDRQISGSGSSIVALASAEADAKIEELRHRLPSSRVEALRTLSRKEYLRRSALEALPEEVTGQ